MCLVRFSIVKDNDFGPIFSLAEAFEKLDLGATASDEKEENIKDFGACGNGKFEPLYSEEAPHPAQTALNRNGQERYVCFPVLLGEWGYGDINSRSLLIGGFL